MSSIIKTESNMINYSQKCGEITTAIDIGRKVYILNCIFCDMICSELNFFMEHIEEEHYEEIYGVFEKTSNININEIENKEELIINEDQSPFEKVLIEDILESSIDEKVSIKTEESLDIEISSNNNDDGDDNTDDDSIIETETIDVKIEQTNDINECSTEIKFDWKSLLIDLYKKHTVLWDPEHPLTGQKQPRKQAVEIITKEMNLNFNLNWKLQDTNKALQRLRSQMHSELNKKRTNELNGLDFKTSWFLEKMSFCIQLLNADKQHIQMTMKRTLERSTLPIASLTTEQNIKLIDIYKSFQCLWDEQHIENRFREKRNEANQQMLLKVHKEINLEWTQSELQKKIYAIRHACTQEKYRQINYERLNENFKPLCKFYEYIKYLLENVPPFVCSYCNEMFNTIDQHNIHKSKHDGTMPFICSICNHGFVCVSNRTVHLRRHLKKFPFECKICGKCYATNSDRKVHMRCHTGEKPYFCELCGKSLRTNSLFNNHMRHHQNIRKYQCNICLRAFFECSKLKMHMLVHNDVRDKNCNDCNKSFKSLKALRQHKLTHLPEKRYSCKICGKRFAQGAGLCGHMKSHGTTISGGFTDTKNDDLNI